MFNNHWRKVGAGLLVASLLLAACGSDDDPSSVEPGSAPTVSDSDSASDDGSAPNESPSSDVETEPDTASEDADLTVAASLGLQGLDPPKYLGTANQLVETLIYETLVSLNTDDFSIIQPELATSWEVSDDGLTYTFTLRDDVAFQTGATMTADDVKFAFDRLKGLKASPSFYAAVISEVRVVDSSTVEIDLVQPDSSFLAKLSSGKFAVYDSQAAIAAGATADPETDDAGDLFDTTPLGSGPWQLQSFTPGEAVVVSPFDGYWGESPAIQTITLQDIPEAATQAQLLSRGDIDLALGLDVDSIGAVEEGGSQITTTDSLEMLYVGLTALPDIHPALSDPSVRTAIQLALDYEGVGVGLAAGSPRPAGMIPLGLQGADLVEPVAQNVEEAKRLIEQYGQDVAFDMTYVPGVRSGVDLSLVAEKVRSDLEAIGVTANLVPADQAVWLEQLTGGTLEATVAYTAPAYPDCVNFADFYGQPEGSFAQRMGHVMPAVGPMWDELLASQDSARREELCGQIVQEMVTFAGNIPLVQPIKIYGHSPSLTGIVYPGAAAIDFKQLSWTAD